MLACCCGILIRLRNPGTTENQMTMFNRVTPQAIAELKRQADTSEKQRSRLNLHPSVDDAIQEMIIVFSSACRMPPHKNLQRSESVHVIEGSLDLLVFDQEGA